jgi:hypothetical protein
MSDIKQLTALTALNEMFSRGHFSITTIDTIAKMLGIDPKGEAYDTLRPLHCIDYSKMPAVLRDEIPSLIKQCLGVQPFYQYRAHHDVSPSSPRPSLLRLIGIGGK